MKYVYKNSEARKFLKYGIDLAVYEVDSKPDAEVVYEEVEIGHHQEWYSDRSTYQWFVIEGKGTFVINGEQFDVEEKDLVAVPPNNKMYYFGKMKMLLITSPPYNEEHEHHVRDIDESELKK